MGKAQKKNII